MKMKIAGDTIIEISLIMACCFLTSCFGSAGFPVIKIATTKNIDLPGETGPHVRGESCSSFIIIFPVGAPIITIEDALENALKKGKGDLLRDAVVAYQSWEIPLVYARECWIVEGTILKVQHPLKE